MSDNNRQDRALLEYHRISQEQMMRVSEVVWLNIEADCWILHDKVSWNGQVVVTAKQGKPFNRQSFNRGGLVTKLKSEGLGKYGTVHVNRIDKATEAFIKRPDVVAVNAGNDDQEELLERVKGPQGQAALCQMDKKDAAGLYQELMDDACNHIRANIPLKDFYAKHEHQEAKSNILIRHASTFNNMWSNYSHLKEVKKPAHSLEETMQAYLCQNSPGDVDTDYIQIVGNAGHGPCLEAIYRIFFERKDAKKNLVWLYGAPNSGKTTLIRHLETIFCAQEFNFQDKYCTVQNPSKDDQEVQLAVSKEFEVDQAFSMANYTSMKKLFEGMGAPVSSNKYIEYKHMFEGKQFIVASNKLPKCSFKYDKDHEEMWKPMLVRMEMVYLKKGFPGETDFPYTAAQLAAALTQMINSTPTESNNEDNSQEEAKSEESINAAEKAGHMEQLVFPASQPSGSDKCKDRIDLFPENNQTPEEKQIVGSDEQYLANDLMRNSVVKNDFWLSQRYGFEPKENNNCFLGESGCSQPSVLKGSQKTLGKRKRSEGGSGMNCLQEYFTPTQKKYKS